ncbi:MAG: hypothetical protein QM811_14145 [Pirellulales bacterium]
MIISLLCSLVGYFAFASPAKAADTGQLVLSVIDRDSGEPAPVRIHLKTAAGKPVKIPGAIQLGDHGVFEDKITLKLPLGHYSFTMEQGPESLIRSGKFEIQRYADDANSVDVKLFAKPADEGWYAGDLDAARASDLPLLMKAENLKIVAATTWENDKSYWTKNKPPAHPIDEHSGHRLIDLMAGEDERGGSAIVVTGLREPLELPNAKATTPTITSTATSARVQTGQVHAVAPFIRELPLLIAAGKLDSIMLLNRHVLRDGAIDNEAGGKARNKADLPAPQGNARWSLEIYYKLLEAGIRIPITAGSGSGHNLNPLGYNRVYAFIDGELTVDKWFDAVRAGRTIVTNGPILRCKVEDEFPGHVFASGNKQPIELETSLTMSTRDKVDYLEIVKNGITIYDARLDKFQKDGGQLPPVLFRDSGWFLIRAVTVEDKTLRYATTAPYYVEFDEQPRISKKAVQFFLDWVEHEAGQFETLGDRVTADQRSEMEQWRKARTFWKDRLAKANVE